MDHESLILGELREFKRAALERLSALEKGMASLQRAEAMRRGKVFAVSAMGSVLGAGIALLTAYIWR